VIDDVVLSTNPLAISRERGYNIVDKTFKHGGRQMLINSKTAEESAILNLAYSVCAAARTAPKACGIDHIDTAILTGEDKNKVTAEMRRLGESFGESGRFFCRDADNVDASGAVVLVGAKYEVRGLGTKCKLCGFEDCAACEKAGAACVFTAMDLGIALGSAVSLVADNRVDNRLMFTIGQAAASLGLLGEHKIIIGIPLFVGGKSVFYDRED
jgi:uncharacterized ferredoxin-like protein